MRRHERAIAYYDGSCPLCSREIGFYRRQSGADRICWVDIGTMNDSPDLSREQALARFTVRDSAGRLVSGGRAFTLIWKELPRFQWLAKLFSIPPFARFLDSAYGIFLMLRPRLQTIASRRGVRSS